MNASTSPDMIQLAADCSRYWIDLVGRKARDGSGYSRRAETPILRGSMGMMLQGLPEDALEILPRALPRVGLVAGVVHGDVDQLRQVLRRHALRAQLRGD